MSDVELAREAYEQTRRDYEAGKRSWVGDAWQFIEAFKAGFAAGQVAALEDAASKLDLSDRYDPSPLGLVSRECQAAETKAQEWLRARAAELSGRSDPEQQQQQINAAEGEEH